jgi:hypothetical protein
MLSKKWYTAPIFTKSQARIKLIIVFLQRKHIIYGLFWNAVVCNCTLAVCEQNEISPSAIWCVGPPYHAAVYIKQMRGDRTQSRCSCRLSEHRMQYKKTPHARLQYKIISHSKYVLCAESIITPRPAHKERKKKAPKEVTISTA